MKNSMEVYPDIKGLIFDMDGTLTNSLPVHLKTWRMLGEKYGFEFDPQILKTMTGKPTVAFAETVIKRYNLKDIEPHALAREKQELFWSMPHLLEVVEEVLAIVKEYYGKLPMAVGTGASRRSAEVQMKALNLGKYFEGIVSADDVTNHKPHPETFLECAEIINVEPQFCQVFEDGSLGIEAAKTAGMKIVDVREHLAYGDWLES